METVKDMAHFFNLHNTVLHRQNDVKVSILLDVVKIGQIQLKLMVFGFFRRPMFAPSNS